MADDIEALFGGNKPDVTIECSGVEASVRYTKKIGRKRKKMKERGMNIRL